MVGSSDLAPASILQGWRRKKAYCRAIGVKGKSGPVLMNRLSERIESAGEMGLARPDTPPDGIVWSTWYFDIQ